MNKDNLISWLPRLLANGLAVILLWAGLSKLIDLPAFAAALADITYLPRWLTEPLRVGVPAMELVLAGWLVGLRPNRVALYATTALFAAFLVHQILIANQIGWLQAAEKGCGCFSAGAASRPAPQIYLVGRNVLFVAGALLCLVFDLRAARQSPAEMRAHSLVAGDSDTPLPA